MKNLRIILPALVLATVSIVIILGRHDNVEGCSARYRVDKVVHVGKYQVKAEEAKTSSQQQTGLGGRACIGPNHGMLFTFDKPGRYSFWMKDMKFPIDIAWINTDHKVVGLEKNVAPSTYPNRFVNKDKPAQYVVELQAGRADAIGMTTGTAVNF